MKRLTEYYDGEARVLGIGHKKAFAKLAAYEDTELTPEDVAELKLDIIAVRSSLVDVEKAFELACKRIMDVVKTCPKPGYLPGDIVDCSEIDCLGCYKDYFLTEARGGHEAQTKIHE